MSIYLQLFHPKSVHSKMANHRNCCNVEIVSKKNFNFNVKQYLLTTSRGRSNNSVLVVPIGEVNKIRKLPRGKNRNVILHWTCSRNLTSFIVPAQPLTSMCV